MSHPLLSSPFLSCLNLKKFLATQSANALIRKSLRRSEVKGLKMKTSFKKLSIELQALYSILTVKNPVSKFTAESASEDKGSGAKDRNHHLKSRLSVSSKS